MPSNLRSAFEQQRNARANADFALINHIEYTRESQKLRCQSNIIRIMLLTIVATNHPCWIIIEVSILISWADL